MPVPDFSVEMEQIAQEKENPPSVESVESRPAAASVPEPASELGEDKVFDKRERLLAQLAKARVKSAEVRKAKKAAKDAAKKPRGRPKKQPEPEPEPLPQAAAALPQPVAHATPEPSHVSIDYDRIINGVHNKYMETKKARDAAKKSRNAAATPAAQVAPAPVQPAPPQTDLAAFEAQIRADEQANIKRRVAQAAQEKEAARLRKADQQYYSRLPPPQLGNAQFWDRMFGQ